MENTLKRNNSNHQIGHRATNRESDGYECVETRMCQRWAEPQWGVCEGAVGCDDDEVEDLYLRSDVVPHSRKSAALLNALQIALPCAL